MKYDKITSVEIGRLVGDCVTITNVLYFADRVVSVEGDMVSVLNMINTRNPGGVHQSHAYWELEMCLDTDWLVDRAVEDESWAYHQNVDNADTLPAIVWNGANTPIEWFKVNVREHDGTAFSIVYADTADELVLWCVGEVSELSNEDNTPHQTTKWRFICLQEGVRS